MTNIAFVGLGNMGGPMALNLVKHGHQVVGFDLSTDACARLVAGGGKTAGSIADALEAAEIVISDLFGSHPLRVAVHCVLIGIFLALAATKWRRAAQM